MGSCLAELILEDARAIPRLVDFAELRGKTVLITGASGLVGHFMVASIAAAVSMGIRPAGVYLVVSSTLPGYFEQLADGLPVTVLAGDLSECEFSAGLPKADYIIHAAGYGQPGKFMADPAKTLKLNTAATCATLCKLNDGGKYLYVSSSEVYSGLPNAPFREDQIGTTSPEHPRSCYIEGKRCGEAFVNAYRAKGLSAKSARLSLAYGPGTKQDDARVINSFIKKAILERRIEMLDAGAAWRTYIYIADAAETMFNILLRGTQPTYNVGGKSRTTIRGLAEVVGALVGAPVVSPDAAAVGLAGAPDDVFLDMSRSETEFGKRKYLTLEDGLKRTIAWQRELYGEA